MAGELEFLGQRTFLQEELRNAVIESVLDLLVDLALALIDSQGLAPNDIPLDRDARIMKMIEDGEFGTLDEMAIIAPRELTRRLSQFRRDVAAAAPELAQMAVPSAPVGRQFAPAARQIELEVS